MSTNTPELIPLRGQIELVPAIELDPWDYSRCERPFPASPGANSPEDYRRWWAECLAESGITGLQPLWPGSWLVTTTQLTDPPILDHLVEVTFRKWELEGGGQLSEDNLYVLTGGLGLYCDGRLEVGPACCCDLKDWSNWLRAAEYRGAEWQMLWIGHPWLSVRWSEGSLILSEPHESDQPVGRWLVAPEQVASAVTAAEQELEAFAGRLLSAVSARFSPDAGTRLVRMMVGLENR